MVKNLPEAIGSNDINIMNQLTEYMNEASEYVYKAIDLWL